MPATLAVQIARETRKKAMVVSHERSGIRLPKLLGAPP